MRYYNPNKKSNNKSKRQYSSSTKPQRDYSSNSKKLGIKLNKPAAIIIIAIAVIIVLAITIPNSAKAQYSVGYEVMICGKSVGVVDSPNEVDTFLSAVRNQFAEAYGMKVTDQLEIEYVPVQTANNHICTAEVFTNLISNSIKVKVLATIIYVNDWPAAAVSTQQEAQWVLSEATLPYETPSNGATYSDISFVEDVRIQEGGVDYYDIVDKETALHNLTVGPGVEMKYHHVVTGDALSRIARKYGIKVSDIKIANPQLSDEDKIYPGDKLAVVTPKNSLSIKYTEIIDRNQEVECEVIYQDDDTKYTTEKEVLVEGKNGEAHVRAEITYINGIEVEFSIIEQETLSEPEARVIKRGTKSVPKELTLASEGKMSIPLSGSYVITSPYGPRDTGILGASKFHKGIDLRASVGTPVYASSDGTVHFAGTGTGYGLYIRIKHDGNVETRYAHLSQTLVKKGDKVKKGDLIALSGNTGVSEAAHLHFEVRINGEAVDPMKGTD